VPPQRKRQGEYIGKTELTGTAKTHELHEQRTEHRAKKREDFVMRRKPQNVFGAIALNTQEVSTMRDESSDGSQLEEPQSKQLLLHILFYDSTGNCEELLARRDTSGCRGNVDDGASITLSFQRQMLHRFPSLQSSTSY